MIHDTKHLETVETAVLIPLIQSAITGAFAGLLVVVCGLYLGWRDWFIVSVVSWLGVTFGAWLLLHRRWLVLTAERLTGYDINQDGAIGEPGEPARDVSHQVRVDMVSGGPNGAERRTVARLPVDEITLSLLAVGLLAGRPFSERHWTGAGRPLSVNQFRELRDEMKARGIIEPVSVKDTRQGYKLTAAGRAVMRHFSPADGLEVVL